MHRTNVLYRSVAKVYSGRVKRKNSMPLSKVIEHAGTNHSKRPKHRDLESKHEMLRDMQGRMKGLIEEVGGGLSAEELLELHENPATPSSQRPPDGLIQMYKKLEGMKHLQNDIPSGAGTSFKKRVAHTRRSQAAKQLVDEDRHGWRGSEETSMKAVNRNPISKPDSAPVNKASIKAKFLFGEKARKKIVCQAATIANMLPPSKEKKEVAFVGRANLGKSLLLNTLVNKRVLPSSRTQGETQELTFVECGSEQGNIRLVDTPGIQTNIALLRDYLMARSEDGVLAMVMYITDADLGIDKRDLEILNLMGELEVPFHFVVTRTDQFTRKHLMNVATLLQADAASWPKYQGVAMTTCVQKLGLQKIQNIIAECGTIQELGAVTSSFRASQILPALPGVEKSFETRPPSQLRRSWEKFYKAQEKERQGHEVDKDRPWHTYI